MCLACRLWAEISHVRVDVDTEKKMGESRNWRPRHITFITVCASSLVFSKRLTIPNRPASTDCALGGWPCRPCSRDSPPMAQRAPSTSHVVPLSMRLALAATGHDQAMSEFTSPKAVASTLGERGIYAPGMPRLIERSDSPVHVVTCSWHSIVLPASMSFLPFPLCAFMKPGIYVSNYALFVSMRLGPFLEPLQCFRVGYAGVCLDVQPREDLLHRNLDPRRCYYVST